MSQHNYILHSLHEYMQFSAIICLEAEAKGDNCDYQSYLRPI